jgi:acyl-CoA thioester hydrolase
LTQVGVEVWRGGVNTWDCDGMGHLNVRFYIAFAMEGLAGLAAELGLPHAFTPEAPSTIAVREHHIRYLREARDHAVLHMTAGVVEIGESDALIVQLLYHSMTGEPCAAIQTRVAHVTTGEMRPFPWSAKVAERAKALMVLLPDIAKAKSLSQAPAGANVSLERANALGLQSIGLGLINPVDCDAFGRMAAHHLIGHVSDGITGMVTPFRQAVVDHSETKPQRFGGAALEYRAVYLAWPRIGDRFTIRSGISGVDRRAMRMTHWLLDPLSGRPWGGAEAVVTTFDLERRKIVPISEAAQAIIGGWVTPGLTL